MYMAPNAKSHPIRGDEGMLFAIQPKKKAEGNLHRVWFRLQDDPGSFIRYTLFDKSGTVRVGRYQDPRTQMGHLISNSEPGGTLNCFCQNTYYNKTKKYGVSLSYH